MSAADRAAPVSAAEAADLFATLCDSRGLLLAVSGGPDSTALLWLAAQWRRSLQHGPALLAVTVDHGLRPEARSEAEAVKRIAKLCGVAHRTMRWSGPKPTSGLQQAARQARYRLLSEAAAKVGADRVLTGHTCDDQAETVLIRMSRGSGIAGLGAMAPVAPLPGRGQTDILLVRPFLDLPKTRLIATLADTGLTFVDDPSNRDPRFTRSRLRRLMPELAREGLSAARLSQLAWRLQRAEAALEAAADAAWARLVQAQPNGFLFDRGLAEISIELQLRLVGRAIARIGNEGPVELGKLEALHHGLFADSTGKRLRRTLAGAVITRDGCRITVEQAPPRRRERPVRDRLNYRAGLAPQSAETAVE